MGYGCLGCGSLHGEPAENGCENWFWRLLQWGKVGPFCSERCSWNFQMSGETGFSLVEWERLHFLKWRVQSGELVEQGAANG